MIRDTCQANNAEFVIWNTEAWISKHRWSAHLKPLGINLLKKRIRRKTEQSCNENLKSWNIQCNFFLIVLVQCKQFSVIISYLHNLPRPPWSSTEINFYWYDLVRVHVISPLPFYYVLLHNFFPYIHFFPDNSSHPTF